MHACMHAESLQSCPTLCNPRDSSPPGSSVHRILQARILEWAAISFSSRSSQNFFSIIVWGIDLDYHDTEWFALEMNRDHSVIFEIASQDCISDSFVDYEGYSISSKEFSPTVAQPKG